MQFCSINQELHGEMGKAMPVKVNIPKTFNTEQDEKVDKWLDELIGNI